MKIYGNDNFSTKATKSKTINFTADADITLGVAANSVEGEDDNEFGYLVFTDTGAVLTATRNVIVNTVEKDLTVTNNTAQSIVIKTSAGTGVTILAGEELRIKCDGINVVRNIGNGKVLQVVQNNVTTTSSQSIAAEVITEILGLNASITPTSSKSRIRVDIRWSGEHSAEPHDSVYGVMRDAVNVGSAPQVGARNFGIAMVTVGYGAGADNSSTPDSSSFSYIDAPNTTATINYKATVRCPSAKTLYNNRTAVDTDSNIYERLTSTIILTEIGI